MGNFNLAKFDEQSLNVAVTRDTCGHTFSPLDETRNSVYL